MDIKVEDLASVLLRFDSGAKGSFSVGQVCAGHKNDLELEICGSTGITRVAATSAKAPRATTPAIYTLRSLGIKCPASRQTTSANLPSSEAPNDDTNVLEDPQRRSTRDGDHGNDRNRLDDAPGT